ncbi:uncharacterized protein LOC121791042 [Salvia splendens]|uniref:uncharacterized protein LOC121774373 n=1 Tax=Salvia splendens TaxID=180675 RepID=UPI001C251C2A|nr:uncharacterized protein LOC121774373 [Salvia splendens]XP_042045032.1 uncharacterized protein LOC121791042 [Salvia splendens]
MVWQVQMFVQNSLANGRMKPKHRKGVQMRIAFPSHAGIRRSRPLVMPIKWIPPDEPWVKLNTNGAFFEETSKAGGGRIVQDHAGKVLAAFATPLEAHSAFEAEHLVIHHGLVIASEFRLTIWVESDAAQTVRLLNGPDWGPAHLCRIMALLANHKCNFTIRASFIHREGNKPTYLAKMGLNGVDFQRMNGCSLPRHLKAMARLDEMGVPNLRIQEED